MFTFFCLLLTVLPCFSGTVKTIEGHTVHGVNSYNNQFVLNLNEFTTFFSNLPPGFDNQVAAYNPSGEPLDIEESTDRSLLVATTKQFYDLSNTPVFDESLVGIPIKDVPVTFVGIPFVSVGSVDIGDRKPVLNFKEEGRGQITNKRFSKKDITIGQWDRISGQLTIKDNLLASEGIYSLSLELCDAIPESIYSVVEAGAENVGTDDELPYLTPAGGLPNLIITDKYGNGKLEFEIQYNLFNECTLGADCTLFFAVFHHHDFVAHAGTPGLTEIGMGRDIILANQIIFAINGIQLQEPSTEFKQCNQNKYH